jgi:nicotinamide-nucleotide amidase
MFFQKVAVVANVRRATGIDCELHGTVEASHQPLQKESPMSSSNSDTILDLAAQAGKALQEKGLILATAESCTGGGVAQAITEIAGSTAWFDCGFITYSNASKTEMLDVSAALIAQMGSVSEEVAAAMATGALGASNAHLAVSTTGIAGPTGAVPGKPVGTVCFGWANGDTVHTERLVFSGDRRAVREQTVIHALQGLLRFIN